MHLDTLPNAYNTEQKLTAYQNLTCTGSLLLYTHHIYPDTRPLQTTEKCKMCPNTFRISEAKNNPHSIIKQ